MELFRSAKLSSADQARLDALLAWVPKDAPTLVIDGGPGMLGERLRDAGHAVTLTDVSAHAVERAAAKGLDATHVDTDDTALPFPDGQFPCVISDSAIEHRYWPEKAVAEPTRKASL